MSGIFLIIVYGLWIVVALALSIFICRRFLPERWWGSALGILLFFALVPLPLIDEIIAMPQFEKLCQEKASQIVVDAKNTRGRAVRFGNVERVETSLGTLKVHQTKGIYIDVKTQEPLYHYYRLEAKGGWLIRALGISEGNVPLLFGGVCQPEEQGFTTITEKLGLTLIDRPNNFVADIALGIEVNGHSLVDCLATAFHRLLEKPANDTQMQEAA